MQAAACRRRDAEKCYVDLLGPRSGCMAVHEQHLPGQKDVATLITAQRLPVAYMPSVFVCCMNGSPTVHHLHASGLEP